MPGVGLGLGLGLKKRGGGGAAVTVHQLGDSTTAAFLGQNSVTSYLRGATFTSSAVAGETIAQQSARWTALASKNFSGVTIQVGLNDFTVPTSAATIIGRLQTLVNLIRTDAPATKIVICGLTPCHQRWRDLYGTTDGDTVHARWLLVNEAIAGSGGTPITGVDGRATAHVALMADTIGGLDNCLAAIYEVAGTTDHIHPNNAGRQVIALSVEGGLYRAGLTSVGAAPSISSPSSGSVQENSTLSHAMTAGEAVAWSIVGGADQADYEFSGSTLRWAGNVARDYELPDDSDTNNTYIVTVRATGSASGRTADQTVTYTVTDQAEGTLRATVLAIPGAKVLFDVSDLSTMKQERTGAAATTPCAVGSPVGSRLNLGSDGGWAIALTDAQRPILRQSGALYYLEYDSVDDGMYMAALTLGVTHLIAAATNQTNGGKPVMFEHGNSVSTGNGSFLYGTNNGPWAITRQTTNFQYAAGVLNWANGTHVIDVQFNLANNPRGQHYKDGVAQTNGAITGTAPTVANHTGIWSIMGRQGGAFLPSAGYEYGHVVIDGTVLDSTQLLAVRQWLGSLSGVTI